METRKLKMLAAALAGGMSINGIPASFRLPRYRFSKTCPHSSKRQSERLERQRAKGLLDFSASERCLAAIKAR